MATTLSGEKAFDDDYVNPLWKENGVRHHHYRKSVLHTPKFRDFS